MSESKKNNPEITMPPDTSVMAFGSLFFWSIVWALVNSILGLWSCIPLVICEFGIILIIFISSFDN